MFNPHGIEVVKLNPAATARITFQVNNISIGEMQIF
jgi:hypothetical protein